MKRENNYDLLRIVSAIAVIMIHVSAPWFENAVSMTAEYGMDVKEIQASFLICFYYSVSRFAVSCFLMLSGAFIIDNHKNAEYRSFYFKSVAKVGVPTMVFSGLYILYKMLWCLVSGDSGSGTLLWNIVAGLPMYHMWYLYMLIGIYALAPVVIRFKDSVAEKTFYKVSFVFLIFAGISQWTGTVRVSWDIGQSFEYLGYFMVGYSIRKIITDKNNKKAFLFICTGILFEICVAIIEYSHLAAGMVEWDLKYQFVDPYSPLIVLASICIFIGFTYLDLKRECNKLPALTLYIYLIHAGVWDVIMKGFQIAAERVTALNGAVWIPLFIFTVFAVSCLLSQLYIWIWGKLIPAGESQIGF